MLLHKAKNLPGIDDTMAGMLTPDTLRQVVDLIPGAWLATDDVADRVAARRRSYHQYLTKRLEAPRAFIDEALRVR